MSWICPICETENPDTMDFCEVCDSLRNVSHSSKQPISFVARYYISGKRESYTGGELAYMELPKGTLVRKMLTDEWIPIDRFEISKPHISELSYYYAWGMKGVFKLSQLRKMHLPKSHLIREMLTEPWFPIGDL